MLACVETIGNNGNPGGRKPDILCGIGGDLAGHSNIALHKSRLPAHRLFLLVVEECIDVVNDSNVRDTSLGKQAIADVGKVGKRNDRLFPPDQRRVGKQPVLLRERGDPDPSVLGEPGEMPDTSGRNDSRREAALA